MQKFSRREKVVRLQRCNSRPLFLGTTVHKTTLSIARAITLKTTYITLYANIILSAYIKAIAEVIEEESLIKFQVRGRASPFINLIYRRLQCRQKNVIDLFHSRNDAHAEWEFYKIIKNLKKISSPECYICLIKCLHRGSEFSSLFIRSLGNASSLPARGQKWFHSLDIECEKRNTIDLRGARLF